MQSMPDDNEVTVNPVPGSTVVVIASSAFLCGSILLLGALDVPVFSSPLLLLALVAATPGFAILFREAGHALITSGSMRRPFRRHTPRVLGYGVVLLTGLVLGGASLSWVSARVAPSATDGVIHT